MFDIVSEGFEQIPEMINKKLTLVPVRKNYENFTKFTFIFRKNFIILEISHAPKFSTFRSRETQ